MPFTLSHPAAVVVLHRSGLPMTAMVAGAMVPDVPMFMPTPWQYPFAHSLFGIVSVDLLAGVLLTALWLLLIRDAVIDTAPSWVRDRVTAQPVAPRMRYWLLVAPAVVVGAMTHVGWDELTHEGRWGARHVPWLAARHLGWAGVHAAVVTIPIVTLTIVVVALVWQALCAHGRR